LKRFIFKGHKLAKLSTYANRALSTCIIGANIKLL